MSGGESGENGHGWTRGVHRVYVRFPGDLDPNDLDTILYAQRGLPPFASGAWIENVRVFGTIDKGMVECTNGGGFARNVQLYYPAHHGLQFAGCQTEDVLIAHGSTSAPGYCTHHFGGEENFQTQKYAHHRRMKIYDWPGAMVGAHGHGGGTDGGGGPDVLMDAIVFDDLYAEDVSGVEDAYQLRIGVTFNRPVFKDCAALGGFLSVGAVTINDMRYLHTRYVGRPAFVAPLGSKMTINGGFSAVCGSALFGGEGDIEFNGHSLLARNISYVSGGLRATRAGSGSTRSPSMRASAPGRCVSTAR